MPKGPGSFDRRIGQLLRLRRLQVGLTQSEVAAALNLTFQQIQKYENGKNQVSASRMVELAAILDVSPTFFLASITDADPDEPNPLLALVELLSDSDGAVMARDFPRIADPKLRHAVAQLIRAMAEKAE